MFLEKENEEVQLFDLNLSYTYTSQLTDCQWLTFLYILQFPTVVCGFVESHSNSPTLTSDTCNIPR